MKNLAYSELLKLQKEINETTLQKFYIYNDDCNISFMGLFIAEHHPNLCKVYMYDDFFTDDDFEKYVCLI